MPGSRCRKAIRLLLLGCVATGALAESSDPGFTATPLGGGVYALQGFECNIVASTGDDGIVVVDTCAAKTADKLLMALKRLSSKPIRFVIDTHVHGDHTGANAVLQKLAPVIARDTVRTRLAAGNEVTGDKPRPPEALPIVTFDGEITLHLNGENIRLLALPPGHTDGDVIVFFERARIVVTGDVFMAPAASFVDRHGGGSILGLIETLELVLPQIPADARVVPGHGKLSTRADVARGLEILRAMKAVVADGIREGKSMQQLIDAKPFEKWEGSQAPGAPMRIYVEQFYRELSRK